MFNTTSDSTFGANTNINGYFTDSDCKLFPETLATGTTLTYGTGTTIYGGLTLNNNGTSMNQQVKVAVFQVERNKHNEIKSSTIIDEFWIEKKPGISIDFAVAKRIGGDYEASEIVIKEIYTVNL
jgi:hypothetical protein